MLCCSFFISTVMVGNAAFSSAAKLVTLNDVSTIVSTIRIDNILFIYDSPPCFIQQSSSIYLSIVTGSVIPFNVAVTGLILPFSSNSIFSIQISLWLPASLFLDVTVPYLGTLKR